MSKHAAENFLKKVKLENTEWGKRIIDAEYNGYFSEEDKRLASGWTTCACGRIQHDIARRCEGAPGSFNYNAPLDSELRALGFNFMYYVDWNYILEAAKCLYKIEIRACKVARNSE